MAKPKLLNSLDNVINNVSNIINGNIKVGNTDKLDGYDSSNFATVSHAHSGYSPTNHANTATTYGIGTTANYGHVKTVNTLTGTETEGAALTPAMGKTLNEKIPVPTLEYITASKTWIVPAGKTVLSAILVGGGGAGISGKTNSTGGKGGSGGGGGGIAILSNIKVTSGQTFNAVIGAGGVAGDINYEGSAGGDTSFGSIAIAYGGIQAKFTSDTSYPGAGGRGSFSDGGSGNYGGREYGEHAKDGEKPLAISPLDFKGYGSGGAGGGGGAPNNAAVGNGGTGSYGSGNGGKGNSITGGKAVDGGNATANSGGGGGGGGGSTNSGTALQGKGGSGGSGIIILLYW